MSSVSLCPCPSFFTCIFYFDVMGPFPFSVSLFPPSLHPMFFLFSSLSLPPPLVSFHFFVSTHCFCLFFLFYFLIFMFLSLLFDFLSFIYFFILIHLFPPSLFLKCCSPSFFPAFISSCSFLCSFQFSQKLPFTLPFFPFVSFPHIPFPPPSSPHHPSISAVLRAAEEPRRLIILLQLHPLTARLHFTPRRQPREARTHSHTHWMKEIWRAQKVV